MEMNGQLQTTAALPHRIGGSVGPRAGHDAEAKRKITITAPAGN